MTPQDFVSCIRIEVVEQNLKTYASVCSMPADEIRDPQSARNGPCMLNDDRIATYSCSPFHQARSWWIQHLIFLVS